MPERRLPPVWLILALLIPVLAPCTFAVTEDRPNIVLIMADDLGYECIGVDGGASYQTPNIDRLAEDGMRFTRCYAQPLCTPSRVQIMTGMYNVRNYRRFAHLDRGQTTFAHLLKTQGYATCIAGKWQLGKEADSAQHFGFDESCLWQQSGGRTREGMPFDSRYGNPELDINGVRHNYNDGEYGPDIAVDFICDFIGRHKDGPFFVYYPMMLTHMPFVPTPDSPEWNPRSRGAKNALGNVKYFADMVEYTDKLVGRIVDELKAQGLSENTLVIFTGDNGTAHQIVSVCNGQNVRGGKAATTDAGTHVPLVAAWPGTVAPGGVCDDLVDFSDFLPTLCAVAGVPVPDSLAVDGHSFLPQLLGEEGQPREWVYSWYMTKEPGNPVLVFAMDKRYKLYRSGKFYDVEQDILEQQPLAPDQLDAQASEARRQLQAVIDRYERVPRP